MLAHHAWIMLENTKCLLNPVDLANYIAEQNPEADKLLDFEKLPARHMDTIELNEQTNIFTKRCSA